MVKCPECRYCGSILCQLPAKKMSEKSLKKILGEEYYLDTHSGGHYWGNQAEKLNKDGDCEYFEVKKLRNILSRF